jgi:hypothetical protein
LPNVRSPSQMINWLNIMQVQGLATLISLLLGFGLAAIFRPLCKGPECLVLRGPPVSKIRGSVYQFGSKCVEFNAKPVECPKQGEIVDTISFADMS